MQLRQQPPAGLLFPRCHSLHRVSDKFNLRKLPMLLSVCRTSGIRLCEQSPLDFFSSAFRAVSLHRARDVLNHPVKVRILFSKWRGQQILTPAIIPTHFNRFWSKEKASPTGPNLSDSLCVLGCHNLHRTSGSAPLTHHRCPATSLKLRQQIRYMSIPSARIRHCSSKSYRPYSSTVPGSSPS